MQWIPRRSFCLLAETQHPQEHSSTWYIILGLVIAFTSISIFLAALVCHCCSTPNRKSQEVTSASSDPGRGELIAENGVFTSCGLKTDFHCCNPWWNIFQKPYEPYSFYENMYWFILGGIKSWLHHGESPLSSWGAVQGYRAHGFNSCSIKDSCFKACGISVLPPGREPTLPELEGWLLIPGPPGTFQALFFPSTTAIHFPVLHDLGTLLICRIAWSTTEDIG